MKKIKGLALLMVLLLGYTVTIYVLYISLVGLLAASVGYFSFSAFGGDFFSTDIVVYVPIAFLVLLFGMVGRLLHVANSLNFAVNLCGGVFLFFVAHNF